MVVVDSCCKKLIGLSGILTTVSANCFYIARVKEDSRVATGQLQSASSDSALQVLRILQADVILGVYMPTMRRPDQKAKAEEKGKKTTEVIEADVVVDVSSSCCVEAGEEGISDVAQEEQEAVDDSLKYPSGIIVDVASVSVPTMRDIHECDSIQYDRVFLMYGRSFDPYSYVGSSL